MQAAGKMLDDRSRSLAGEPTWIRSNLEVFSHPSALTSHDWIQLVKGAGDYVLADLFVDSAKAEAIYSLVAACNTCFALTSCHDSDDRVNMELVKLQVVEALCTCEAVFPRTELAVMLHVLMHVPDAIYRWISARNFWSFFGERYNA